MGLKFSNYTKKCKDTIGGIEKFYILPFEKYTRSQIKTNEMNLIQFPSSYIYEILSNGSYNQNSDIEDSNIFVNQTLTFNLSEVYNITDITKFLKMDFRIIAKTYNGYFLIFGLRNGMSVSLSNSSGSSKSEFNGFTLNFTGKEENFASKIDSLDDFDLFIYDGNSFNYNFNFDI